MANASSNSGPLPGPPAPWRDEPDGRGCRLLVKAVPGARRDEVAGVLGERLKVRVSAPPEDGRANEAIVGMLARALGVPVRSVAIVQGHTRAEKALVIAGVSAQRVAQVLGPAQGSVMGSGGGG
jgi:uncharacterized protein (TIGR00251 family)